MWSYQVGYCGASHGERTDDGPEAINAALPFPMWVCPVSTLLELATAGCGAHRCRRTMP